MFVNTKIVFPTGMKGYLTVKKQEMNMWFDILDMSLKPDSINTQQLAESTKYINKVLDKETELLNGDSKKVFLGGFSQGCLMTLHIAFSRLKSLGGAIGLSGGLLPNSPINVIPNTLLIHGSADAVINPMYAKLSYLRLLMKSTVKFVQLKDLTHSIDERVINEMAIFWRRYATL